MKYVIIILVTIILTFNIVKAIDMSASVEESEMRACILQCGYELK